MSEISESSRANDKLKHGFILALVSKIACALIAAFFPSAVWIMGFFVPLIIMVSYMIFGWKTTKTQSHEIRLGYGDSCYYLGFLFTVASIILSLYSVGIESREFDVSDIAIRFAAAMVTTLLGMAVRVWLVTFDRPSPELKDNEYSGVVADASDGFSVIISANLQNLELLNKALRANLRASQSLHTNLVSMAGRITSDMRENSEQVNQLVHSLIDETKKYVEETKSQLDLAMRESITGIGKGFESLSSNQLKQSEEVLATLKTMAKDQADAQNQSQLNLAKKLDVIAENFDVQSKKVSETVQKVLEDNSKSIQEHFKSDLSGLDSLLSAMQKKLSNSTVPDDFWQQALGAVNEKSNKFVDEFEVQSNKLSQASNKLVQSIEESADQIKSKARIALSDIDHVMEKVKQIEDYNSLGGGSRAGCGLFSRFRQKILGK